MGVSYDKATRERAARDGKGLITIDILSPGKKPGKFGGRMTLQGPADAVEMKSVTDFFVATVRGRTKRARK